MTYDVPGIIMGLDAMSGLFAMNPPEVKVKVPINGEETGAWKTSVTGEPAVVRGKADWD